MSRRVLDKHVEAASRWLDELAANLDLSAGESRRALHALRAGLHAIRDRLPPNEALDLAAQLPVMIRGFYFEGWTQKPSRRLRSRAAMVAQVKANLAPDHRLDPVDVLRAVIHLLVEHVSDGEIADVVATLPGPIAELWHDLTGHAALSARVARTHLTQRTGYGR